MLPLIAHLKTSGSPRVEGDEEEDDIDDLENEFDFRNNYRSDPHQVAEAMLSAHLNIGGSSSHAYTSGISAPLDPNSSSVPSGIPLLTYGHDVS